jgi:putative ABC transport system ATP-binding protein
MHLEELAICAAGIEKSYRSGSVSTRVLKGVELEVRKGECVYLVGPSGSGKSTLLSILGCILSADAGSIRILGKDVTHFDLKEQAEFRRSFMGFVFQRFHLFRGLNVWENVRVPLNLQGRSKAVARAESLRLLESVGLRDKALSRVSQLSMGQRQRVALARALAGDPQLILADEPTASLDAISGMAAMQLLRELTQQTGTTVIVVTHDPRIFSMADRILSLEDGRVAADAPGVAHR